MCLCVFFFKQKTAYEMRISDWSSDVCSSDLLIGYLAYYAGLTQALFVAAKRWIGWVPGGLAAASVFACAGFGAVSGSSTATAAVFSREIGRASCRERVCQYV